MYIITIKGEAKARGFNNSTDKEFDPDINELNGIDCQDDFTDYFDGDESYAKDVSNGYLKFEVVNEKLYSITTYDSEKELTDKELEQLKEYTVGQWSDGIGEGFEQNPVIETDDYEISISPWFSGQIVEILQTLKTK